MSIKSKYTKDQILEALNFWKSKLEESMASDESKSVTWISIEELLEQLEIFDNYGDWSEVSGPNIGLVKFTDETLKQLKNEFSEFKYYRKGIGLITVMSRAEYEEETKYWDDDNPTPYEDYLEDEIYKMQEYFEKNVITQLFKPKKVLVFDDVTLNHEEGKTVLAALYAIA